MKPVACAAMPQVALRDRMLRAKSPIVTNPQTNFQTNQSTIIQVKGKRVSHRNAAFFAV